MSVIVWLSRDVIIDCLDKYTVYFVYKYSYVSPFFVELHRGSVQGGVYGFQHTRMRTLHVTTRKELEQARAS